MIMPEQTPVYSFVLPAFNEAMNLEAMASRLVRAGEELVAAFEIVWVDDGSTDGTGARLDALAAQDARIRALHFSRNFGHMAALTAGLEAARASGAVVCLDSDGQHPPELIPELVAQWRAGTDIVQTVRRQSAGESTFKRVSSRTYYAMLNALADLEVPEGAADFRLMDRQVVDALNNLPEHVRFVRGLVHWVGFNVTLVPYDAPARMGGETKYSLLKMCALALSGITSSSVRPLRLSFLLGAMVTGAAALYAVYILWCYVAGIPLVPGWTSMLLVVLTLSGVQLLTLGIASEYLARLYIEQKRRPVYILRKPRPGSRDV
jgi:dolichol-phosphate mannosyltransferase